MEKLEIYRYEYQYAGIRGIGITSNGQLVITKWNEEHPAISDTTRVIRNSEVLGAFSAPIKLFLDPSTKCPLKCPFCLSNSGTVNTFSIDKPKLDELIEQIIDFGILKVKIGGGEPFIYPYFFELIKKLSQSGIYVSVSTSGVTLPTISQEKLDTLKENRVKISISLDGEEYYHDNIRQYPGFFQTVMTSIPKLLKNQIKTELRATLINTPESYNQIFALDKISKKFMIPIRIRTVKPKGRAATYNLSEMYPNVNHWKFFDSIRDLAQRNPLIDLEEVLCYDRSGHYSVFGQKLDCAAGTRSAYVDWKGNFSPCGFIESYFPPETLINTNIQSLWRYGSSFKNIREYFRTENENSECSKCSYVNACQGGCPSVRLTTGTRVDPRCPVRREIYSKERE